ncbi:hypothetical protein WG66_008133 [Moniliophthora roreri]|nr:hypothetical protein WG66_008133 [Moniliophthora roreri]
MSSPRCSFLQPLLETPPVQLYQCRYSYPSAPLAIRKVGDYLEERPANHVPLDHEVLYLRGALQETLAELDRSDSELGRLRDVVRQMEERRRRLMEIAFRLNGMVKTTIRRLPPELLSRIFLMARDQSYEDSSACQVPLTLSHVCSRWRSLVHSEPRLWCIIDAIFHVKEDEASADRLLEFTKFCLQKSKPEPISVTLLPDHSMFDPGTGEPITGYRHDLYRKMLTVLLEHRCRWKEAELWLYLHDEELFEVDMDFPILEGLIMGLQAEQDRENCIAAISAPRLSRMHLYGMDYRYFQMVNLDALTRLMMEGYSTDSFLRILQHSPNLSDVTLEGFRAPLTHHQHLELSSTSQVKSLRVQSPSVGGDIFQGLYLPSISTLEVEDPPGLPTHGHHDRPHLCQFISRSRPPITHLVLSTVTLPHEEVVGTLTLLPTITHLRLEAGFGTWDMETMKGFLRRMTVGRDSTDDILLPNLMDLCLHFETQFEDRTPIVLDMVESRCGRAMLGLQKLAVLRLTLWNENEAMRELVWKRVDVLRGHGLDVQVNFIYLS